MLVLKKRGDNGILGRWDSIWKDFEVGKNIGLFQELEEIQSEGNRIVRRGVVMGKDGKVYRGQLKRVLIVILRNFVFILRETGSY